MYNARLISPGTFSLNVVIKSRVEFGLFFQATDSVSGFLEEAERQRSQPPFSLQMPKVDRAKAWEVRNELQVTPLWVIPLWVTPLWVGGTQSLAPSHCVRRSEFVSTRN